MHSSQARELLAEIYEETDKLAKIESTTGKAANHEDNEQAATEAGAVEEYGQEDVDGAKMEISGRKRKSRLLNGLLDGPVNTAPYRSKK